MLGQSLAVDQHAYLGIQLATSLKCPGVQMSFLTSKFTELSRPL